MSLDTSSVPGLWKLARLQFDDVRQQSVLLYPEGVVLLNGPGAAILELCDGHRSVADIASTLGERFKVDVLADVLEYLNGLVGQGLISDRAAKS